ncbi:YjzD family protein [Peribacillus glennii]|uniref:DUF2929 family protein n=1 Tax=Peribacillus glennii TaxID=2303991 RepID=A0A372LDN6_9BACI|nr:YjzD family protein [Peribacillus glennii]RFU64139.1 DUF2929 family protein [Peribacillus glennii]
MQYFWTVFWSFILTHMLTYVVSSMIGTGYDLNTANILSVAVTILILIVPAILPDEPVENTHH